MAAINWGIQVDPDKLYPVNYTIHKGVKTYKKTCILGKDMTENQIIDYVTGAKS